MYDLKMPYVSSSKWTPIFKQRNPFYQIEHFFVYHGWMWAWEKTFISPFWIDSLELLLKHICLRFDLLFTLLAKRKMTHMIWGFDRNLSLLTLLTCWDNRYVRIYMRLAVSNTLCVFARSYIVLYIYNQNLQNPNIRVVVKTD